jgi:hypothetical protein
MPVPIDVHLSVHSGRYSQRAKHWPPNNRIFIIETENGGGIADAPCALTTMGREAKVHACCALYAFAVIQGKGDGAPEAHHSPDEKTMKVLAPPKVLGERKLSAGATRSR